MRESLCWVACIGVGWAGRQVVPTQTLEYRLNPENWLRVIYLGVSIVMRGR